MEKLLRNYKQWKRGQNFLMGFKQGSQGYSKELKSLEMNQMVYKLLKEFSNKSLVRKN